MFRSLEFKNLHFTAWDTGQKLLDNISLRITAGERIGLTGPSGSGKTTLCYHLGGLHRDALTGKSSGEVYLNDLPADMKHALYNGKFKVGMVLQNPESQLFASTVVEEVGYGIANLRNEAVAEALHEAGLEDLKQWELHDLSLGQKQRVVIAAFLALRPDLLILDEPTNSLDSETADNLFAYLLRLDCTQIIIEHDLERLASWADRIIEMAAGQIILDAPTHIWLQKTRIKPRAFQMVLDLSEQLAIEPPPGNLALLSEWAKQIQFPNEDVNAPKNHPENNEALIHFDRVTGGYGKHAPVLHEIELTLHRGEIVVLLGRNGSGKTTLLKHIAGLLKPLAGDISWQGTTLPYNRPEQLFGRVGLVFQNPDYQLFDSTVARECGFCLRNHQVPPDEIESRVDKWLERFGLANLKDRAPLTLSYGEKRRLTLASIMVAEPQLLLLDEPTTALDETAIAELRNTIIDLVQARGFSICIATHDADFALDVAHRIVFLNRGRIEADVPTSQVTIDHFKRNSFPIPLSSQIAIQCGITDQPVGYSKLREHLEETIYEKTT
ncbi:energy-coupling factor ABC transporter ATP-binding protein [candidate division KSB1 bacterium]|nr:energy-coupling factor ABC transporter ATP-binding protein [candidate division KSB1 bacterium]